MEDTQTTPMYGFRTPWTPAMDRYFIDLMLVEVVKGSKINDGHLFNKRAWKNMTVLFNAKFGSQCDKHVLKNRHKTLRKLYKSVRNLLNENGFSWDGTLQMVIADDDVWDDYIKVNPNARSYRTKTVPYYSDLCMIYKSEVDDDMDKDSNLNNESREKKIDGSLEIRKSPVRLVSDEVLEASSVLYDEQNLLESSPMSSSSSGQSSDDSLQCPPVMENPTLLNETNSSVPSDSHANLVENVVGDAAPPMPQSRSTDGVMMDYSGMNTGSMIEGSISSILYGNHIEDVLEPSDSNVEVEISYRHAMDQLLMPSAFELSNNNERMVDIEEMNVGRVLEGHKSPDLSAVREDQVDNVQEPSENLAVDVEASYKQNDEQAMTARSPDKCTASTVQGTTILAEGNNDFISMGNGNDHDVPDTSNSSNRYRTSWSPPMDRYFIDLMLDQVQKGNMVDGACRKQAWKHMITIFNAKFGFHYDTEILKNRYKTLRKHYNAVKRLLDQPGFIWDDSKQMVTADDSAWHSYVKAHPDAGQYRTRIMPYYNDLCLIYTNANVDGRSSISDRDIILTDISATKIGDSMDLQSPTSTSAARDTPVHSAWTNLRSQNKRQVETTSMPLKKLRCCRDKDMEEALREMASAVSSLAEEKEDKNALSIENVIHALQAVPEIDDELLLDACDFLEDDKMAKTFMALDVALRKKWLLRKLRSLYSIHKITGCM